MKFAITGLNHKTAPVEVRERLALREAELAAELDRLKREPGLSEGLILSTCNRVEVAVALDDRSDARESVARFLSGRDGLPSNGLEAHLYTHTGADAVRHLFRVASSLDSMVVGEPQILGQLKAAFSAAKEQGCAGSYLDLIVTRAFGVAKRVRTETDIGQSAVSVSYAAVELAREIFGELTGKKVMLLGAGKMSALTAKHLRRQGTSEIYVTNRTHQRAVELAAEFQGWIVEYAQFEKTLPAVDILITSSGAPHYVITEEIMRRVVRARRNRPMFLIDIAVPRNIEPSVNKIDNIFLYDIDDLQQVVERNLAGRVSAAQEAERIIGEEVEKLEARLRGREAAPHIVSLQAQLERVRAAEMERVRPKLAPLTPQQEEAVEALTRGIINKIAHGAIAELRRSASAETPPREADAIVEVLRRAFRVEGGER
jgi:glutamyl-tRNA reductase